MSDPRNTTPAGREYIWCLPDGFECRLIIFPRTAQNFSGCKATKMQHWMAGNGSTRGVFWLKTMETGNLHYADTDVSAGQMKAFPFNQKHTSAQ